MKKKPIGFGRKPESDLDPNGTGDGFRYLPATPEEPQEPEEVPKRQPLVEPVFVDDMELNEILQAYNLFPLAPVSKFDYQLVQIIAALELEVKKHLPADVDE